MPPVSRREASSTRSTWMHRSDGSAPGFQCITYQRSTDEQSNRLVRPQRRGGQSSHADPAAGGRRGGLHDRAGGFSRVQPRLGPDPGDLSRRLPRRSGAVHRAPDRGPDRRGGGDRPHPGHRHREQRRSDRRTEARHRSLAGPHRHQIGGGSHHRVPGGGGAAHRHRSHEPPAGAPDCPLRQRKRADAQGTRPAGERRPHAEPANLLRPSGRGAGLRDFRGGVPRVAAQTRDDSCPGVADRARREPRPAGRERGDGGGRNRHSDGGTELHEDGLRGHRRPHAK